MSLESNQNRGQEGENALYISAVIPVFDERDSLEELTQRLQKVLAELGPYEIIFVNDGSRDGSAELLDRLARRHPGIVKVIHLQSNRGKATALQVGLDAGKGKFLATLDADLQDQPEEIPNLLRHLLDNRLDVVSGWKVDRQDPLSKRMPSRLFNWALRRLSGLENHDFNCGLKVLRRECAAHLKLYGQLHRFILVFLAVEGFRIGEVPVQHAPRLYGRSKYGIVRLYEGLFDFLSMFFIVRFSHSPLYFFGFYGLLSFLLGILIGGFYFSQHLIFIIYDLPKFRLSEHPLWLLSPMLFLAGLTFISFGLLGELVYRLHEPHSQNMYVDRRVGFGDETPGDADAGDEQSN